MEEATYASVDCEPAALTSLADSDWFTPLAMDGVVVGGCCGGGGGGGGGAASVTVGSVGAALDEPPDDDGPPVEAAAALVLDDDAADVEEEEEAEEEAPAAASALLSARSDEERDELQVSGSRSWSTSPSNPSMPLSSKELLSLDTLSDGLCLVLGKKKKKKKESPRVMSWFSSTRVPVSVIRTNRFES